MNILEKIVADKRVEIAKRREERPLADVQDRARERKAPPAFAAALRAAPMGLIAEVKRRSPSAGAIREPMVPGDVARSYELAGAQAVSVLMDHAYFGGGESDFREVRSAIALPMLYKEFVIDPWQIWHAREIGASVVLLIVSALTTDELRSFLATCGEAGVEALVEVHGADEMRTALEVGASCVGVNNRNLKTFEVSLETSERVGAMAAPDVTRISESGIRTADDVARLRAAGFHGILVGEQLLRRADTGAAVRELMSKVWVSS